jgi:hypothetical protein
MPVCDVGFHGRIGRVGKIANAANLIRADNVPVAAKVMVMVFGRRISLAENAVCFSF